MALSDNRAKIQALIDSINAQPGGGSGGGGLPVGVSKLISGSFTPTHDITDSIIIPHGFGEKPTFSIVAIEDDVSETMIPNALYWQIEFLKKTKHTQVESVEWREYIYSIGYGCIENDGDLHVTSTWNGANINPTCSEGEYSLNDTTVWISPAYYGGSIDIIPFKAGHTYRWVCGVIDGIN